jgi:hypothetical protein
MMRRSAVLAALALASVSATAFAIPFSDPRADRVEGLDAANANEARDPACRVAQLVSAGAPAPRNPHTLAVRWIGFSNYELVYNGHSHPARCLYRPRQLLSAAGRQSGRYKEG